uniref:G protein-coupled receptor n=1 Tax=Haemonchus contortus TaxID=6289 RepID=A0A7I5ECW4_HAECO
MYPFNHMSMRRTRSELLATPETISLSLPTRPPVKDLSDVNGHLVADRQRYKTSPKESWSSKGASVSRSIHSVLMTLQIMALFPNPNSNRKPRWRRATRLVLMLNYSALAILLNCYLLNKNIWLITAFRERFGLMHASTVSCIITGIKPMINIFLIGLFVIRVREHMRLIKTLDTIDFCFRSAFHVSPPTRFYVAVFFVIVGFFTVIPFTFKVVEFIYTDQKFGSSVIQDTAFIIVPTLSLWNIIPLLYYHLYNRLVRFYCRTLVKSLDLEHRKRRFNLKFYYEQFLRITSAQATVGNLFNPFILFSLAWSMLVLCLTIYFITQPHSSLLEPISPEQITVPEIRIRLTRSVHFTICWAGLQVLVALMHIVIICHTGMNTNETTRGVVTAVLRIVPDANADLDRFQISCFVHKMSTQFMWGMTVWRAFPLERTTFFTLVSVIVTYAFLLLKLKENPAMTPITRQFIIHNNGSMVFTTTLSP